MHCFDDDHDVNIDEEDVTSKPAASSPDSKPSTASPQTTKKLDDQCDEGKVGFVLIPLKDPADIPLFASTTQYVYWPALIYSSFEDFESNFTIDKNTRQLYTEVARERSHHEANVINSWKLQGIVPSIVKKSDKVQPVKVAILFGSEIPPCGMRSYPVFPKEIPIVRGGVLQKPQVAFKKNAFKNMPGYLNNSKFQEAISMARKYKTAREHRKELPTMVFASLKLR